MGNTRLRIGPYSLTKGEVSGAFADLGVLIPLEAALIAKGLGTNLVIEGTRPRVRGRL